jgi:predicted Zn-dependent peptidase
MNISQHTLKNGIECLAILDSDCPSVTTTILVRTGSRYENINNSGIAHLIEHMIFKGTKKRKTSRAIANDVELLGGSMNAFTGHEYTGFYLKAPKQNSNKVLEVLADIFKNSIIPQIELDKEKKVILEEIKMYEDIPMEKVQDIYLEKLFPNHPLGRNIAGNKISLNNISRDNCLDFIGDYYSKQNIVIVVAGGFCEKELLENLNKHFSADNRDLKTFEFVKAKCRVLNNEIFKVNKKIEQSHIVFGGYLGPRDKKTRLPLLMGNIILSGGFGSKLFQKIREELGLAYYINLGVHQFTDIGFYSINMGVDHTKKQFAIEKVNQEIKHFLKGDISPTELERAKNYLIGNLSTNLETSEELANWHGIRYLLDKEIILLEKFIKKIERIEVEDILKEWSKYLIKDNTLTITYGSKIN